MFVPVTCTNCGKPFQVPEASLGQLAPCPWCAAAVIGRAEPGRSQDEAQPEPLSLDDAPAPEPKPPSPRKRFLGFTAMLVLGLLIAVAVAVLTVAAVKRKGGHFIAAEWRTFRAPDGSCSVDLPGTPVEDPDAPAAGGRRYVAEGWYSGAKAWLAWKDLTPAEVQMASGPEAWQLLRPTVLNPEKERLKSTFGGYEAEGAGTKSFEPLVVEYRLQTPEGLLVERAIVKAGGPRPRAYFVGMVGKRLAPDSPELERLFSSFHANE